MSNFALDVNSSQGDIVSSLNYALSNLGTASAYSSGNVLTANVQTGAITTGGNTVAYLYQYMNVAYGNSATGSGFTSNSYHTTYYGIHNNTANVADTNPADYQWTQVSGGFGTTKQLYYQTLGGRQISFDVNTVAPKYFSPVQDNTPINLDIVTGTTGSSGISTYYYPVYATGNTVPYTPVSINGTGNWNFGTKVGIPPLDPIYQNPPISTFSINVPTGWTSYSNVINGYTYYTIFPANVNSQYGTGNLTITGNSAPVDIFVVGSGGIPSQLWSTTAPGFDYATGGSGGQTSFISNVKLGTGTYNLKFSQPYFPPVPGTGNPPPFPTWYGGNVAITYSNSTPILSSLGGNTLARYGWQDEYFTIQGNVSGGFGNGGANPPPGGWGGINGAGGAPDPWGGVITWVGQPAANGLAFFGAGAGGIYNFNTLPPYPLTGVGGLGGAGNALPYGVSTTAGCYGLPGSGGGGAWRGGNFSGVVDLLTQGSGAIIIRKYPDQSLYTPTTWSNLQPNTGSISSNTVVWISSALATSNTATGNATSLSWTMPAQISGNAGVNGANGTPGVSTYSFTVYTASSTQPSTPQANTGSWNFSTNSGTAPLGTGFSQNFDYTITWNTQANTSYTTRSDTIGNISYFTTFATGFSPFNNNAYPNVYPTFTVNSAYGSISANLFLVGQGGNGGSLVPTPLLTGYEAYGGNGGSTVYQSNVIIPNGTYTVVTGISWAPGIQEVPGTSLHSGPYNGTVIADTVFAYSGSTHGTSYIVGNTSIIYGPGNVGGLGGGYTTTSSPSNGAPGVLIPMPDVTWVGVYDSSQGGYTVGGGGGGVSTSGNLGLGSDGGGNAVSGVNPNTGNLQIGAASQQNGSGGGGGATNVENDYFTSHGGELGFYGPYGGQGSFIMQVNNVGTGWVLSPPNPQPNEVVWSSTAIATTSNANVAVTNLTWSTPSQVSGQRGVFSSAYVVTPSDPTFYTATQFTANFSAPRTNTTPPIGTGYTPITGDTATFTYRPTNTVVTKTFYANLNQWLSANTQVISGNLFVSNSITASALITTDVYPLNIISQNATIGNIQSPGFWMQASTGNARFGGNISIGNNLIVGNNALFGNNMIIGNSLAVGNNASIGNNLTVGNNTVIGNSLGIGNNAIVGNAMAIGNYLTVGTNASIGNNLFIGNNAIIGNSASIGANLIVGQSASIGNNLIVGNNAVIGGNLTILGLVSGGNLSANVVNTTNIAYNAITATQMAPLSIASTALQSASLLSRMFAPNSVPPSALSPAASVQLITVIDSSGTSISDPTLDEFYDFGPTVTVTVNPGDQILISVTGTAILGFDDTVPYVSEFTTTFKIIGTNPDSSVNGSGEQIAYWMTWAEFNADVQTNYQTVEHTFTATQAGTMTFSLQFAYGYTDNKGAEPNSLSQDGATTMVALLAPYTG